MSVFGCFPHQIHNIRDDAIGGIVDAIEKFIARILFTKGETNFAFDPEIFLTSLRDGNFNWLDLRRLVRCGWNIQSEEIIDKVQTGFGFLSHLISKEAVLAGDLYRRQLEVYHLLVDGLRNSFNK